MSIEVPGLDWSGNRVIPGFQSIEHLDVYDLRGASPDVLLAATTCAGLINYPRPRVYLICTHDDEYWLRQLMPALPQTLSNARGDVALFALLDSYRESLKGLIIYDPSCIDTINVATTLAGLRGGMVVAPGQMEELVERYQLPLIRDFRVFHWKKRIQAYLWAKKHLLPQCTTRFVAAMRPEDRRGLRSFLVATRTFVYWLDLRRYLPDGSVGLLSERSLMRQICRAYPPGSLHLGWVIDEPSGVALTSRAALPVLASDHFDNLEVWTSVRPASQQAEAVVATVAQREPVDLLTGIKQRDERIYVSFTMSDGDNIQYCQHRMLEIWQEPVRGTIPLGWTLSPLLLQAAPALGAYYRQTATANDELIAGPSGIGYMFPSHWPQQHLAPFLQQTGELMAGMGMSTLEVLDAERLFGMGWPVVSKVCWNGMTLQHRQRQQQFARTLAPYGVRGLLSGAGFMFLRGRWQAVEGMPVCHNLGLINLPRTALWFVRTAAKMYAQRPLYLNVYINAWSVTPTQITHIMQELGDEYTFVLPGTLLSMLSQRYS